jgi:hypothetical protein
MLNISILHVRTFSTCLHIRQSPNCGKIFDNRTKRKEMASQDAPEAPQSTFAVMKVESTTDAPDIKHNYDYVDIPDSRRRVGIRSGPEQERKCTDRSLAETSEH